MDITKEYLTRRECEKAIHKAPLSRSESVSIPRQLAAIFETAEQLGSASGTFQCKLGGSMADIRYSRQDHGAASILLHRDSLMLLVPSLANTESAAAKVPEPPREPKHTLPHFKHPGELGPEWATFNELVGLLRTQALKNGKDVHLNGALRKAIPQLLESFKGETGTVGTIRCHKFRGRQGHSVAIHREDTQALFEYVGKVSTSTYLEHVISSKEASLRR